MTASAGIVVTGAAAWVADHTGASKQSPAPARWTAQPARLARMDRLCALALVAADGALLDAGSPALDGERTAIVLGTAYGCHATNEEYYRGLLREGASPRLFAYTLPSSPVGEISIHHGIRGPATTVASGLHAGLAALGEGVRHLLSGRADRAIVVAAEVASALNEQLAGRPLRDGAAAVILERGTRGKARIVSVEESFPGVPGEIGDTLSAAPLIALSRWLGDPRGTLRLSAADPAGGAATLVAEAGST